MTDARTGLADAVARRACAIEPAGLSHDAHEAVRAHVLDCLGLTVVGRSSDRVRRAGDTNGGPDPVVLLSLACGALGLDDFDEATRTHPAAVIVPALLVASAEASRPVPGDRLAAAVILGYEMVAWLGAAMDARNMHPRGRHPTAVVGVPSVALAGAWLAGLPARVVSAALGIGAGFSFGLAQFDRNEDMRALQTAAAASAGLRAARFAAAGFASSAQALEGPGGLLGGDASRVPPVTEIATVPSAIERVSFKPYPHFSDLHPAVAALLTACDGAAPDPAGVVAIRVFLTEKAASRLHHGPIANLREAKRSPAFVLAFALRSTSLGGPDLRIPFSDRDLIDGRTRALADHVDVRTTHPAHDSDSMAATVEIALADGKVLRATSNGYPGDGRDARLRWDITQVRERFTALLGAAVRGDDTVDTAIRLVDRLATSDDIRSDARALVRTVTTPRGA